MAGYLRRHALDAGQAPVRHPDPQILEVKIIMIESVCTDPETVERNIRHCKLGTPDYVGIPVDEATRDFRPVAAYESTYETIDAPSTKGVEKPVLDQDRRLSTVRDQQRAWFSAFSVDPV